MAEFRAGIGFSDDRNSFEGGKAAAATAVGKLSGGDSSLILAFCAGRTDAARCFEGIRSVTGDSPVIGGSAIGVITNSDLGYSGHQVGVAALPAGIDVAVEAEGNLDQGERAAGLRLGQKLSAGGELDEQLAVLFYGSVRAAPPPAPVLNVSTYLMDGVEEGLGQARPTIVGAGLVADFDFSLGVEYCGDRVGEQQAVAAAIMGDLTVQTSILHGCQPMSDYHTITRIEGPVLYEIDGKPALDVINDLLGGTDWQQRMPLLVVTLGVNHGEKYGPYDEASYVNRLIVGIVPEEKAIVLFEADFEPGTEFQFMRRNAELMAGSAADGCRAAVENIDRTAIDPVLALYIDCAGRASAFSGADREEAAIVQDALGDRVPLLGFYSGVEIAPLLGRSRGLDWTGVLMVLGRSRQR